MTTGTLHTDKTLFRLIAQDDEQAFASLFIAYQPKLKPVVLQVVKQEFVVNDIIQDIFLGIWIERHTLDTIEEPRKRIFRLLYNRCFRWLQRQEIEAKASRVDLRKESVSNSTSDSIDFSETSRLIQQAIADLTPQAKKIYLLKRQDGLKISEIAIRLDISEQSVKNSLHRSGTTIKDYLARYDIYIPFILLVWS